MSYLTPALLDIKINFLSLLNSFYVLFRPNLWNKQGQVKSTKLHDVVMKLLYKRVKIVFQKSTL